MPAHPEMHTDLPPLSAGRLLVAEIPALPEGGTIADAEALLIRDSKNLATINYLYLVDKERRLTGVLSLREIFTLPKSTSLREVAVKDLISVRPHTKRDRVAFLAIEHSLKEIPVVDSENHLLGSVPYDAILRTLREDHVEDSLRTAGVHAFESSGDALLRASPFLLIKKRAPWLMVGVLGSAIAAIIISSFQNALEGELLLAAFIPAVTYIAGAVGIQSETILIKSAALDRSFSFVKYLVREIYIGLGLAFLLGIAIAGVSFLIWQAGLISLILGLTFFTAVLGSMAIAVFLPWVLSKFRLDPAITGGPLDTILSDITSIAIYFLIANAMLTFFLP